MKRRSFIVLSFLIVYSLLLSLGCRKKSKCEDGPFVSGNIIGFDPCTAYSSNEKGYVIKFEDRADTVVAYFVLPNTINIPDSLFSDYRNSYLFPQDYRSKFFIKVRYRESRPSEYKLTLCRPDILLADFIQTTKQKQYTIECTSQ